MYNKIFGILFGILISMMFYYILKQRCSIIIGNGIVEKYNNHCITVNNRCM
jgi:hypothetical protein